MNHMKKKKSPASVVCSVLGTAILIAVIISCLPLVVPKIFGGQFLAVVSGSMEPEIPTGSLVYVKAAEPKELQPGEIIAFYGARDTSTIVTHRVLANHPEDEKLITKGDANKTQDMNPTRYDHVIGKVEFHIPKVGFLAQMITSVPGKIAFGGMIGLAVVLHLMADSIDNKKNKMER